MDQLSSTPVRARLLRLRRAASTASTCCWAWMSLFSVAFCRYLRPPLLDGHLVRLEDLLDGRLPDATSYDVLVIGAGGAGLRAAIEAAAAGVSGRPDLQVAARQGAHGDGRRRHGRGAGQRRRPRQLAGPLRRHDARRPVPQQLAHGRAARQGSAGPRARARGLGRGVRPHDGRPHPPAQLRRPPLSAPRARRRPHRPRDDPHAAGSRHPPGHRRPHGVHGRHPAQGRRPRGGRVRLRPRARPLPRVPAPRRSSSPPAASAAPSRSPATAGNTPATATRWPTTPAPS